MKWIKRLFISSSLAGVLSQILVIAVFATVFSATITITNTSATNYTYLPLSLTVNNDNLATQGYISSDGTDVQLYQSPTLLKRMLVDDRTLFVLPTLSAYGAASVDFTTNNTVEDFDIISGYGGYITVADDADLEWGNSGNITISGYFDPTSTGYLFNKENIKAQGNGDGTVTLKVSTINAQVISGGSSDTLAAGATEYNTLMGSGLWDATESVNYQLMPTAGTLDKLFVRLSAAVAAEATYTITVMKNGVAQALAVTINAGSSTGSDLTHSVTYAAGDYVSIRSTSTGAPGAPFASWTSVFSPTTSGETIFLLNSSAVIATTRYHLPQGNSSQGNPTSGVYTVPVPTAGTFSKLYVKLSASPGAAPDAYSFTPRKNTVDTALTCTITDPATTGNDIVNSFSVVAGDLVDIKIAPLNAPAAAPTCAIGMVFTPTTAGESVVMGGGLSDPSVAATNYNILQGANPLFPWTATEANTYQLTQLSVISKLYVKLYTPPDNGAGVQSFTFDIREGGADTGLTVTISEAATTGNDVVNTYTSANGTLISMKCTPSGGPKAGVYPTWSFVRNAEVVVASVTSAAVSEAKHTFSGYLLGGNLGIQVDGGVPVTSAFAGSIEDNGYDWTLLTSNIMVYADYIEEYVSGTRELYFKPNAMIVGTTLPDREATGGVNNGTFTWGTNPASISVEIGRLTFSSTYTSGTSITSPDVVGVVGDGIGSITRPNSDLVMPGNEFYPSVNTIATLSNIPIVMIWWFISFVIALLTLGLVRKYSNSIFAGGLMAVIIMALFCVFGTSATDPNTGGCLEWWQPAVVLIAVITQMVTDRTYSM